MFTIIPLVGGVQHKVGGAHGRRQHVGAVVVLATFLRVQNYVIPEISVGRKFNLRRSTDK